MSSMIRTIQRNIREKRDGDRSGPGDGNRSRIKYIREQIENMEADDAEQVPADGKQH